MPKPMIGLVPLWDEQKNSVWMLPNYMESIQRAGGLPVMLPLTADSDTISQLAGRLDGLLFTGGHDIEPALYGEEKAPVCGGTCPQRDAMEGALFEELVLRLDKPALGICRGIQLINVLLGGTLYQDLPTQLEGSTLTHRQQQPYDEPAHQVRLLADTPLHRLLMKDCLAVNSLHHQGVKRPAHRLRPMAEATDGLVEAAWMPDRRFLWAVQWHPEYTPDDAASALIFQALIEACR